MLCRACYMTAMLLVWRRRRRIGAPIAMSWTAASSCAHNTLLVTGTPSRHRQVQLVVHQLMHGFRGSREGSPEWYPAGFRVDPHQEARARQHLSLVCRSYVLYQGCFRRQKILESARRLSEYLLACLVDIRQSTRNRIQWNDEVLDDSDAIWRRCFWLIHQMTKRGRELWPRGPFCASRFLSRARKEWCVIWSSQGMECGKSFCLGGRHRTAESDVMNWNVPQFVSNYKWNTEFVSANITEERYPQYDYVSAFRNNQYALTPVRYCIRCMQHHSRIELIMASADIQTHQRLHRTPQYMFIQSWYYNLSCTEDGLSNGYWQIMEQYHLVTCVL